MTDASTPRRRIAVLGADSFIGQSMFARLRAARHEPLGTTRRDPRGREGLLHLDLLNEPTWHDLLKARPDIAIAFFAISKLDECEVGSGSHDINALRIPDLLERLAHEGCRTVFLSTNSMFGGSRELPDEDDPVKPQLAYARQKHEAELRLRNLPGELGHVVVRITRSISADLPPFKSWIADLRAGKPISAFEDFIFAPMTLPHVTDGLLRIAMSKHSGVFHLSGTDVTYFDFAREFAAQLARPLQTVHRTNSLAEGVHLWFKPQYSALGMRRTTELLGLRPQPFAEVVAHLLASQSSSESP